MSHYLRGRSADRFQWSAIVVVLLTQEIVGGLIGHTVRRAFQVVVGKIAYEWRRLRR
jgi:hypothetical protein